MFLDFDFQTPNEQEKQQVVRPGAPIIVEFKKESFSVLFSRRSASSTPKKQVPPWGGAAAGWQGGKVLCCTALGPGYGRRRGSCDAGPAHSHRGHNVTPARYALPLCRASMSRPALCCSLCRRGASFVGVAPPLPPTAGPSGPGSPLCLWWHTIVGHMRRLALQE